MLGLDEPAASKPALAFEFTTTPGRCRLTCTHCHETLEFWANEVLTPSRMTPGGCERFRTAALTIFGEGGTRRLARPAEGFFPYGWLDKSSLPHVTEE